MNKKSQTSLIIKAIEKKLDIKRSRIYSLSSELAMHAQTKTEDGISLLAAQSGINLNKYLNPEKVSQIREFQFKIKPIYTPNQNQTKNTSHKIITKNITVNICKDINIKNVLLSEKTLKEVKEMSETVYPLLYIFENSVRELIQIVMKKAHGIDWWNCGANISSATKGTVKERMENEEKNPWHGRRGSNLHPIYYSDLEHLSLIVKNNWSQFKKIFRTQEWFVQRVSEIAQSRNPVAHMNPLSKDDIDRIIVYFKDWQKLVDSKIKLIY